ncbi:MAG: nucleoside-diphosphate kinase [Pseudoclavibacter sp.]
MTGTPAEDTLVLIKPDGVERSLSGEVLARIERKGYQLIDLRMITPDRELLTRHYAEHEGKPFFEGLLGFMSSGPVVAARVRGIRVIEGFRSLAGPTDPTTAPPGTIRGDLGRAWDTPTILNIVHGSDSPKSAERELAIWFGE